ncbi:MAG TPA: GGDEF domain-containing protein [Steroidobacteraceae bacterium]|nr:GGDEF domain-containing protein [Steroidobacteraceae bacterium]
MASSDLLESVAETTKLRDPDDVDHAIVRLFLQYFSAAAVTVYRLMDDGPTTRVAQRACQGVSGVNMTPQSSEDLAKLPALEANREWHECVRRRQPVQYRARGLVQAVFPIDGEREVAGILTIEVPEELPARELSLVQGVLSIVRNHLALLEYGERDALTGLLNRKTFESRFDKLRQRFQTSPGDLHASWLGLTDIDRFKLINDSHGHLFGDEVLLLISRLMRQSFRGVDQLFRFGGEEFVIVLGQASSPGALVAFERFRAMVEAYEFPQVGRVTVSLGCTRITSQDVPTICVERADAALYYAKRHGRNRVFDYEALIAEGKLTAKDRNRDIELF